MPGPLSTIQIRMNDQTRTLLQSWVRRPTKPSGLVRRARALLLLEGGQRLAPTARQVGLSEFHLRKWARRFGKLGVAGLREQPRCGRPPVFSPQVALYVVKLDCERPYQFGRSLSQWNCSELARQLQDDGVITFFRTRFPAKACQGEKKPESFPLSQRVAFSSHERRFD